MRSLSVGDAAPSAVVENTNLPGTSLVPGVPSQAPIIDARESVFVPSEPSNIIVPTASPL